MAMPEYRAELDRRTEQIAEYLRLMGLRRRKIVKNDDCFAIFDDATLGGVDAPQAEESAAVKVGCLASGGPAADEDNAANPPSPGRLPAKPLRYVQFCFSEDCFYVDLSSRTLLPHEAESILQQRAGFYWAKDRPDLRWVRANLKDYLRWNPLQKIYQYGDEESAAEDMAFVLFDVWQFPVDWPWCVTAAAFHTDHRFEQGYPFPPTTDMKGHST